jgi:hypothetical protein
MPKLEQLHPELSARSDRFVMIGLTSGLEDKAWREFLDSHGMEWTQAILTRGNERVWDDFHVRGIPDHVVIGPDGKIVDDGESTDRDIEKIRTAIVKALGL